LWVSSFFDDSYGIERPARPQGGQKVSGGHFLGRGRFHRSESAAGTAVKSERFSFIQANSNASDSRTGRLIHSPYGSLNQYETQILCIILDVCFKFSSARPRLPILTHSVPVPAGRAPQMPPRIPGPPCGFRIPSSPGGLPRSICAGRSPGKSA